MTRRWQEGDTHSVNYNADGDTHSVETINDDDKKKTCLVDKKVILTVSRPSAILSIRVSSLLSMAVSPPTASTEHFLLSNCDCEHCIRLEDE